jgi:hypothetical protein
MVSISPHPRHDGLNKLEQERLEQERLEQERQEQERQEQERQKQERRDQEGNDGQFPVHRYSRYLRLRRLA